MGLWGQWLFVMAVVMGCHWTSRWVLAQQPHFGGVLGGLLMLQFEQTQAQLLLDRSLISLSTGKMLTRGL